MEPVSSNSSDGEEPSFREFHKEPRREGETLWESIRQELAWIRRVTLQGVKTDIYWWNRNDRLNRAQHEDLTKTLHQLSDQLGTPNELVTRILFELAKCLLLLGILMAILAT